MIIEDFADMGRELAEITREFVARTVGELATRLQALETRIATVRDGTDGAPGLPGERGEKGDPLDVALVLEQLRPEVRASVQEMQKSFMGEFTTKLYAKALSAGFSTASVPRTTTKTITYGDVDGMKRPIAIEESTS